MSEHAVDPVARLRGGLLVCDGALGTMLSARGHAAGASLDAYNLEQPDLVRAVHRAYYDAGADVMTTNTFQATSVSLSRHGLAACAAEINFAGAALAREVAGPDGLVAGNVGPTGGILEPYGDLEESAVRGSFEEACRALAEGGADFLLLETFTALEEARLAVIAAAQTGLPVAATMAFDPNGRTVFGVTPEHAAEGLAAAGAMAVGANCGGISPQEMVAILAQFRRAVDLPLVAQPNAGRPERQGDQVIFPASPDEVAACAPDFRGLGVTLLGGCCGTTPKHIRAIRARLARP